MITTVVRFAALAGVALGCACGPAAPPDAPGRGSGPGLLRVATWNVHDLFDAEDRIVAPGAEDTVLPPDAVEAKLSAVAAVLARIDADVVLLQEVETRALAERLAERAGYAAARLVEGRDARGIDVAALSRLPVLGYVSHLGDLGPDGRPLWPRDCVELHVAAGATRVVLVGSHLSSPLSDDGTRRAAQAARMREIADALAAGHPGALVLAGGDLNDEPGSPALSTLLADGAWLDPAPPGAVTWSSGSRSSRLDYLLVPRASAGLVLAAEVVSGADVSAASDHLPLALDLYP
jgi:endonuclease/exonuclease/phosphatase family metal-dependent hydrolase